jgi:hypothetical protein
MAAVGAAFTAAVESLASDNQIRRMAGAVLLRRFFDQRTEQGATGAPYAPETLQVIAGMLRQPLQTQLQKVLADGLRYASNLQHADLQGCDLKKAYLGTRLHEAKRVNLSFADLFEADCTGASFRAAIARGAVFYRAKASETVYVDADLSEADFRGSTLRGARFTGARIDGAKFAGAIDIPPQVKTLLDAQDVGGSGAVVLP